MKVWYGLPCLRASLRSFARSPGSSRIAMSCFVRPVLGRPTRLARLSSSSVDSGTSEKSIWPSGICLALLAARLTGVDDPDRFLAMPRPPDGVDHEQDSSVSGPAYSLAPCFALRVP